MGLRDRDNQVGHANTLVAANTFRKAFRTGRCGQAETTHMEKNWEPPP